MNFDIVGTVIFSIFALLVFRTHFNVKIAIILASILPLAVTKLSLALPYWISERPVAYLLTPTTSEIILLTLQLVVNFFVLSLIKRDNESMSKFALFVAIGISLNYMLLLSLVR